jgi:hypothetical protein
VVVVGEHRAALPVTQQVHPKVDRLALQVVQHPAVLKEAKFLADKALLAVPKVLLKAKPDRVALRHKVLKTGRQ